MAWWEGECWFGWRTGVVGKVILLYVCGGEHWFVLMSVSELWEGDEDGSEISTTTEQGDVDGDRFSVLFFGEGAFGRARFF